MDAPVWTGAPLPGVLFRKDDLVRSLAVLPMLLFFLFWEYFAVSFIPRGPGSVVGYIFPLFGGALICVALYQIFGRYFWEAYRRGSTTYALTMDAALITVGGSTTRVFLPALATIGFEMDDVGMGTIVFGEDSSPWFAYYGRFGSRKRAPAFEFVRDAQKVYDLCTKSQRKGA